MKLREVVNFARHAQKHTIFWRRYMTGSPKASKRRFSRRRRRCWTI